MIVRKLEERSTVKAEEALAILDRLYREEPVAMAAFFAWVREPGHTSTVSLFFRDGQLHRCERSQTAK